MDQSHNLHPHQNPHEKDSPPPPPPPPPLLKQILNYRYAEAMPVN